MSTPRVLVLRAPGTNCDHDAAFAFETAGARAELAHINRLLERPALLKDYQILCLPGGFSYGDDIAAGRILANQMRHHLADTLQEFKAANKLILGICNGFQILVKSGVLLPDKADEPLATLTLNASGKFEDRWVNLRVASSKSVFLRGVESIYLPIAHAEGKFVTADEETLNHLEQQGQLALRYTDDRGEVSSTNYAYPINPNGAVRNVAGVCDESGHVLGLMPHPERFIDPTQHPRWTREKPANGAGLIFFQNAVSYFA